MSTNIKGDEIQGLDQRKKVTNENGEAYIRYFNRVDK